MSMTYTLVRHTGFSYGGNPQFAAAVEERAVHTAAERKVIASAGGLLFDTYSAADERANAENYPVGHGGVIPGAKGAFVHRKGFDEEIYIPHSTSK